MLYLNIFKIETQKLFFANQKNKLHSYASLIGSMYFLIFQKKKLSLFKVFQIKRLLLCSTLIIILVLILGLNSYMRLDSTMTYKFQTLINYWS